MTAFSYGVSVIYRQQFREPVLLNNLLYRANVLHHPRLNHGYGWTIHFTVGLLFNVPYYFLQEGHTPTWLIYLLFGAFSGAIACVVWEIAFLLHPNPPTINYKGFYIQLFIAHIIFGMGSWLPFLLY